MNLWLLFPQNAHFSTHNQFIRLQHIPACLELVYGPDVADCEVEAYLHGLARAVLRPHLLVVALLDQQGVQRVGNLESKRGARPEPQL